MNRTTPCPLIHHITLLRALLRAEGKEARGEGWEGGGESPADLVTHAPKKTCSFWQSGNLYRFIRSKLRVILVFLGGLVILISLPHLKKGLK